MTLCLALDNSRSMICKLESGHKPPHKFVDKRLMKLGPPKPTKTGVSRELVAVTVLPDPEHRCHARGCTTPCKPEHLMCFRHWKLVPREIQLEVWEHYRVGQCDDKEPSEAWMKAADRAIEAVWKKEQGL